MDWPVSKVMARRDLFTKGGKWGYVDRYGKFLINPKFKKANRFSEGLADIQIQGKTGYIDRKGNVAIQPQFDYSSLMRLGSFSTVWYGLRPEMKWVTSTRRISLGGKPSRSFPIERGSN